MVLIWIILIVAGLIHGSTSHYYCNQIVFEVTCTGLTTTELSEPLLSTLSKPDITYINITHGHVPAITASTLNHFFNLQTIALTSSELEVLEDASFSNLTSLKQLILFNNSLETFNGDAFGSNTKLSVLDLSQNVLNTLSDFNISQFPKLKVLNLTNNLLKDLPESLLKQVEDVDDFYLIIDNNPWDCNSTVWTEYLSDKMIEAFCLNNIFDYIPRFKNDEVSSTSTDRSITQLALNTDDKEVTLKPFRIRNGEFCDKFCDKHSCEHSESHFVYYLCIVFGVILGVAISNVNRLLRKLS